MQKQIYWHDNAFNADERIKGTTLLGIEEIDFYIREAEKQDAMPETLEDLYKPVEF